MVKVLLYWLGMGWLFTAFFILPVVSYFNDIPVSNLTVSLFMIIWMGIVTVLGAVRLIKVVFDVAGGNDRSDASG